MPEISTPIKDRLEAGSLIPEESQVAYHCVVHILIPNRDRFGQMISGEEEAERYLGEILDEEFLDWDYLTASDPETGEAIEGPDGFCRPIRVEVSEPYVTSTFLEEYFTPDGDFEEDDEGPEEDGGSADDNEGTESASGERAGERGK